MLLRVLRSVARGRDLGPRVPGRALLGERGQVLVPATLIIIVLLGIIGLVVDAGYFYAQRRHAQSSVDSAATAAAHVLASGGSMSEAVDAAEEYAAANGFVPDGGATQVHVHVPPVSGPHQGDGDFVEVVIEVEPETFFIHALLQQNATVQARGVAGIYQEPGGPYVIFANETDCGNPDALEINGSNNVINGRTHSNSNIKVGGSDNAFNGETTYVCNLDVGGQNNTFDPSAQRVGEQPLPVEYDFSDFPCDVIFTHDTNLNSVQEIWVGGNQNSNQLLPGVYCSTRKLSLSGSDVSGEVTLVAMQNVNISGSNFNLTPRWNNILLFTEDDDSSALDVSGSGGFWTGLLLAPNGKAKVAGSSNTSFLGGIVANTVQISGSDFSITGNGEDAPGPIDVRLVE